MKCTCLVQSMPSSAGGCPVHDNRVVRNMDYCPKTELVPGGFGRGHIWDEHNVCRVCHGIPQDRHTHFANDLERLINRFSQENGSDTPDFILAQYLLGCLSAWNDAVKARERWFGRSADALNAAGSIDPQAAEPLRSPLDQ